MKKFLFLMLTVLGAVALCSVFVACSEKPTAKLGQYDLEEKDGKFGLKEGKRVIFDTKYDKIYEDAAHKAIVAVNGDESTFLVDGRKVIDDMKLDSIVDINADFVYLYSKNGISLWKLGTSYVVGPFENLKLIDNIIFLFEEGKWGAATTEGDGLAPRSFNKIFVVKNGEKMAVLVKDKTGWAMYTKEGVSDGKRYNTPSRQLEKKLKKLNVTGDFGVYNVKWPL